MLELISKFISESEQLILILSIIGLTTILLLVLCQKIYYILIVFLLVRPLIEMTWETKIIGSFSLLDVSGVMPFFILLIFAMTKNVNTKFLSNSWLYKSMILFFSYIILHLIYMIMNHQLIFGLDSVMRLSNSLSGLILFPLAFSKENHYKSFLNVIIISSIIPFFILLLQLSGSLELRSQTAVGYVRYSGFFNGPVNLRYIFTLALLATFAKMICDHKVNVLGLIVGILMLIGILLNFSKAGTLFILILPLIFATLKKDARFILPLLILTSIPIIWIQSSDYFDNIFLKEISAMQKNIDIEFALQGRVRIWEVFWDQFSNEPFMTQMLGSFSAGKVGFGGGIHNDFFLNLCRYGYVGLLLYSFLVFVMLKSAFLDFKKWLGKTAILDSMIFIARAVTALWLIDSIGLHPSMYPSLMLFVFGVFGLIFFKIHKYKMASAGIQNTKRL